MAYAVEVVNGEARNEGRTLAEWVPRIVRQLFEAADPEKIILFGSVARGDDGPDSEIDVTVVLRSVDTVIAASPLPPLADSSSADANSGLGDR